MNDYKNAPLAELVEGLISHLETHGYARTTRERFKAYYAVFLKYAKKRNIHHFTLEIGKTFLLQHHEHRWEDTASLTVEQNYLQRHIRMLHEFQQYGKLVTMRRTNRIYALDFFEDVINDFLESERKRGLKPNTIAGKRHMLNKIFEYLEGIGLTNTADITAKHIYGFLESRTYFAVTTKECIQYLLRSLIRYLHGNNACREELLKLFPVISIHTKNAYPSCFKSSDVTKVLQCVDTSTLIGKRDYLILLLAAELGMRIGDICALKIENINAHKKCVEYIQQKTGATVMLTVSDEILYAFADYMKNARPKCSYSEILISHTAPIRPFRNKTFYETLQIYLRKAGVDVPAGQKHGMHTLRSSLASNMLNDGESILTISNILGHNYVDTSRHYIKIDLAGLRKCVLEVPTI